MSAPKKYELDQNGYPVFPKAQVALISIGYFFTSFVFWLSRNKINTIRPLVTAAVGGMSYYAWTTTFFMFALCIMAPVWGKLVDKVGKKKSIYIMLLFMIAGELFSSFANSIFIVVIGQFICGIGAAGVQIAYYSILGDILPAQHRGKIGSIILISMNVQQLVTPLWTAAIAEMLNWRSVFYVCIALYIIDFLVVRFCFPDVESKTKAGKMDYTGLVMLFAAVLCFTMAFSLVGKQFTWGSPIIWVLLAVSIVIFFLAFRYESKHKDIALLSIDLLKNKSFLFCCLVSVFMSAGMTGMNNYMTLKATGVMGYTATTYAATVTSPTSLVGLFAGALAGLLMDRTGRFKWMFVMATLSSFLIYLTVGFVPASTPLWVFTILVFIWKITGSSFMPSINPLGAIAVVEPDQISTATGNLNFFTSLGQTVMSAILGAAYNTAYSVNMSRQLADIQSELSPEQISTISAGNLLNNAAAMEKFSATFGGNTELLEKAVSAARTILNKSITVAFITMAALVFLSFLSATQVQNVSIKEINEKKAQAAALRASKNG